MSGAYDTIRVSFMSRGIRCAAWLTLPGGPGPHPGLVLAHGLGATHGCCCPNTSSSSPKPASRLSRLTTDIRASPTVNRVSNSTCARTGRTLRRPASICANTAVSTLPGWVCGGPAWVRCTCCRRRRTSMTRGGGGAMSDRARAGNAAAKRLAPIVRLTPAIVPMPSPDCGEPAGRTFPSSGKPGGLAAVTVAGARDGWYSTVPNPGAHSITAWQRWTCSASH